MVLVVMKMQVIKAAVKLFTKATVAMRVDIVLLQVIVVIEGLIALPAVDMLSSGVRLIAMICTEPSVAIVTKPRHSGWRMCEITSEGYVDVAEALRADVADRGSIGNNMMGRQRLWQRGESVGMGGYGALKCCSRPRELDARVYRADLVSVSSERSRD